MPTEVDDELTTVVTKVQGSLREVVALDTPELSRPDLPPHLSFAVPLGRIRAVLDLVRQLHQRDVDLAELPFDRLHTLSGQMQGLKNVLESIMNFRLSGTNDLERRNQTTNSFQDFQRNLFSECAVALMYLRRNEYDAKKVELEVARAVGLCEQSVRDIQGLANEVLTEAKTEVAKVSALSDAAKKAGVEIGTAAYICCRAS